MIRFNEFAKVCNGLLMVTNGYCKFSQKGELTRRWYLAEVPAIKVIQKGCPAFQGTYEVDENEFSKFLEVI